MGLTIRKESFYDDGLEERIEKSAKQIKKNGDMSKEGFEVSELTAEGISKLNEKWVYWTKKLEHTIRWYARDDDDLTQIGIVSLRKTLCEDMNSHPSYLLAGAKYAIWNTYSLGKSVDTVKSEQRNLKERMYAVSIVYLNELENPEIISSFHYSPEIFVIDKVAYEAYRKSLTDDESLLLDLMLEANGNNGAPGNHGNHREQKRGRGTYKEKFIQMVNCTRDQYERVSVELRRKFYYQFGSEAEQKRFEEFYAGWRPRMPVYGWLGRYGRKQGG